MQEHDVLALFEMVLAAQVDQLDCETARRVARLVLECNASLQLALSAVQEADQSVEDTRPARSYENTGAWSLLFWNKINYGYKRIGSLSARR